MTDRLYRQFMWGLANGITVLAAVGTFFVGVGAAGLDDTWAQVLGLACAVGGLGALLAGGARIRRKAAGFSFADLKNGTELERQQARRLGLAFRWVIVAEWTLFGVGSFVCHHFNADELTASWIGLVISLHFAPLAHLFRLPTYYATALLGSAFAVASMALPVVRLPVLGFGLGCVMWLTAVDSIVRADSAAARWTGGAR